MLCFPPPPCCSDLEEAERLAGEGSDVDWSAFAIGSISACTIACTKSQLRISTHPASSSPKSRDRLFPPALPCPALPSPPLPFPAVHGEVHARKDYGLLCDLQAHADVVGLVAPHQVGGRRRIAQRQRISCKELLERST